MIKFLSSLFSAVILVSAQAVFAETPAAQTPDTSEPAVQDADLPRYTLNRIAAVVNSDVILTSELNASLKQVVAWMHLEGIQKTVISPLVYCLFLGSAIGRAK